jgi:urate oxidase
MALIQNTYGKGRVRVMRIHREGERHEVRELTVKAMLEGAFERSYTAADNSSVVATDTIKNVVNIVARENLRASSEALAKAIAQRFLDRYPQVERANITALETKWVRTSFDGKPHEHTFVLDSNGKWFARASATRDSAAIEPGVDGFTFMKSTGSGWESYVMDNYTTLPETKDRMCATSMDAVWRWAREPASFPEANAAILDTALKVFATTYSEGVQASLYRMGMAVLDAVPEVAQIHMACPNKHYILINLSPFGLENNNQVFLPTDEPHGQIECTVGRD